MSLLIILILITGINAASAAQVCQLEPGAILTTTQSKFTEILAMGTTHVLTANILLAMERLDLLETMDKRKAKEQWGIDTCEITSLKHNIEELHEMNLQRTNRQQTERRGGLGNTKFGRAVSSLLHRSERTGRAADAANLPDQTVQAVDRVLTVLEDQAKDPSYYDMLIHTRWYFVDLPNIRRIGQIAGFQVVQLLGVGERGVVYAGSSVWEVVYHGEHYAYKYFARPEAGRYEENLLLFMDSTARRNELFVRIRHNDVVNCRSGGGYLMDLVNGVVCDQMTDKMIAAEPFNGDVIKLVKQLGTDMGSVLEIYRALRFYHDDFVSWNILWDVDMKRFRAIDVSGGHMMYRNDNNCFLNNFFTLCDDGWELYAKFALGLCKWEQGTPGRFSDQDMQLAFNSDRKSIAVVQLELLHEYGAFQTDAELHQQLRDIYEQCTQRTKWINQDFLTNRCWDWSLGTTLWLRDTWLARSNFVDMVRVKYDGSGQYSQLQLWELFGTDLSLLQYDATRHDPFFWEILGVTPSGTIHDDLIRMDTKFLQRLLTLAREPRFTKRYVCEDFEFLGLISTAFKIVPSFLWIHHPMHFIDGQVTDSKGTLKHKDAIFIVEATLRMLTAYTQFDKFIEYQTQNGPNEWVEKVGELRQLFNEANFVKMQALLKSDARLFEGILFRRLADILDQLDHHEASV